MPDVNWEDLSQPEMFFQLEEGFSKKDLKRAYTRLIKIYKPEQHPDEFQRIRAAYERLDEELSYGVSRSSIAVGASDLSALNDLPADTLDIPMATKENFTALIKEKGLDETLDYLLEKAEKVEEDYLALGLLEEEKKKSPLAMLDQITTGLKSFPNSDLLNNALYEFCQCEYDFDDLVAILEKILYSTHRHSDFYLVENYFFQLLEKGEKETFIRIFELYEREKMSYEQQNLVVFQIRLFRRYFFHFDTSWLQPRLELIEEEALFLDSDWEESLEMLDTLQFYRDSLDDLLAHRPNYGVIHEKIVKVLPQSYHEARETMLEIQEIFESKGFLKGMMGHDDVRPMPLYRVLRELTANLFPDLHYRTIEGSRKLVHHYVLAAEKEAEKGFWGSAWTFTGIIYGLRDGLLCLLPAILLAVYLYTWLWVPYFLIYIFYLREKLTESLMNPLLVKVSDQVYRTKLRSQLIDFFQKSQITEGEFEEHMVALDEGDQYPSVHVIRRGLATDFAPSFVSLFAPL